MFVRSTAVALLVAAWWSVFADAPSATAKDHLLIIGGGYDQTGNQLSLERNVVFQQAVVSEQRPDAPECDIFFADGDNENRDLQCRDPEFEKKCPAARRMMAEIFGDANSMDLFYRNHEVPHQRGPTEKSLIRNRLKELARELTAGDRLIVYVTGHGSPAKKSGKKSDTESNDYNTSFYLWDRDSVSASELSGWLDRLESDVQVVLVMVQCYAGGFSHTIFDQADAELGLSTHPRCGFFAQVYDRPAAGCTAAANEGDYEEYSSYFWGALGGRKRTGEPITSADYDGNGRVSFAEAHSYAVLESDTIDIPVRTSGALLRHYSVTSKESDEEDEERADDSKDIIELSGPIAALAAKAQPDQRAILEGLPKKLKMSSKPTIEEIKEILEQVKGRTKTAARRLARAKTTYSRALKRVQGDVREMWPELNATYAPLAMELTSDRADEFVERVEKLPSYQSLRSAAERQKELTEQRMALARKEARLQRLLQTCENVVLEENLPLVAKSKVVSRYKNLLAMEEGTLVP